MKKYILIGLMILFTLMWGVSFSDSATLLEDNFDNYSQDWLCKLADCSVNPGYPKKTGQSTSDYGTFSSNSGSVSEWDGVNPPWNSGISTLAARGSSGRGFRYYLRGNDVFPTGENILGWKTNVGDRSIAYVRWYERNSALDFGQSSYQKLFRIYHDSSNQIVIPEWYGGGSGKTYMKIWLSSDSSSLLWTNWNLETSGFANQWVCYEVKLDIGNNKYEFWVNDVSKGEKSSSSPLSTSYYLRYFHIGGNQIQDYWVDSRIEYRDYDDVVVSSTKVGCGSAPPPTYSVGGTVSGLVGTVVLQNNLTDDRSISANGSYSFSTTLVNGSNYSVTVKTNPTNQTCTVANGTGTINGANVTNVNVTCTTNATYYTVGGVVSGLVGTAILQNNGGDNKSVSSDGSFSFPTPVLNGSTYYATVYSNPMGQTCTVTNPSGTVSGANVTSILVTCTNTSGGGGVEISTLSGGNSITLGGGSLTLTWGVPTTPSDYQLTVPQVDQDVMITMTADDCPTCPCPVGLVGYCYNCGVRSATEVMAYHTTKGFTNLMTSLPTGLIPDSSTQIETLFKNMVSYTTYNELNYGTRYAYTTMISDNGTHLETELKNYLTLKGYGGTVTTEGGHPSFAKLKNEIDAGYPVMLMVMDWSHWVTVIGYDTSDTSVYFLYGHDVGGGVYKVKYSYASIPTTDNDAVYIHPSL